MEIYIGLFIFLVLYSFIDYSPTTRINKNVYWFAVCILILFAALRGNGYDWDNYYAIYRGVHNGEKFTGAKFIEYGFQLICYISPSYRILIALVAVMSIGLTLSAAYRLSSVRYLPLLGLIVFYSTHFLGGHMGQIRQAIATGFVMWAIVNAMNNEKKRSIILIIIASFFHMSALIALVVPFIPHKRYSRVLYICIILIVFAISYKYIAPLMATFITSYDSSASDKLTVYAYSETAVGFTSTILIRVITLLLGVSLNNDKDIKISFICNVYFYGIIIYGLFNFLPQLGGRGSTYFSIMEIVLVPYIIYRLRRYNNVIYFGGYLLAVILSGYRLFSFFADMHNYNSYIPYLG